MLLAGDAIITKQESALAVVTQRPEVRRPPAYFTINWPETRRSVEALAALQPSVLASGHDQPMSGAAMQAHVQQLAHDFDRIGLPSHGRYVADPVIADEHGIVHAPAAQSPLVKIAVGAVLAALALRLVRRFTSAFI